MFIITRDVVNAFSLGATRPGFDEIIKALESIDGRLKKIEDEKERIK